MSGNKCVGVEARLLVTSSLAWLVFISSAGAALGEDAKSPISIEPVSVEVSTIEPLLLAQATAPNSDGDDDAEPASDKTGVSDDNDASDEDPEIEDEVLKELGIDPGNNENASRVVRAYLEKKLDQIQKDSTRARIDKFLLYVSIVFLVISLVLYLGQPLGRRKKKISEKEGSK